MGGRSWELIATYESTVITKLVFDPSVVEDGESNRCFPNPSCTDESEGFKIFGEFNPLLNEGVTAKTGPRWRGWQFPKRDAVRK